MIYICRLYVKYVCLLKIPDEFSNDGGVVQNSAAKVDCDLIVADDVDFSPVLVKESDLYGVDVTSKDDVIIVMGCKDVSVACRSVDGDNGVTADTVVMYIGVVGLVCTRVSTLGGTVDNVGLIVDGTLFLDVSVDCEAPSVVDKDSSFGAVEGVGDPFVDDCDDVSIVAVMCDGEVGVRRLDEYCKADIAVVVDDTDPVTAEADPVGSVTEKTNNKIETFRDYKPMFNRSKQNIT